MWGFEDFKFKNIKNGFCKNKGLRDTQEHFLVDSRNNQIFKITYLSNFLTTLPSSVLIWNSSTLSVPEISALKNILFIIWKDKWFRIYSGDHYCLRPYISSWRTIFGNNRVWFSRLYSIINGSWASEETCNNCKGSIVKAIFSCCDWLEFLRNFIICWALDWVSMNIYHG